jgi:hypothetical protein
MQTFLPFESFEESAAVLDRQRLGKQRVEVLQILQALDKYKNKSIEKVAWINHPATKMWNGYEQSLIDYGIVICEDWTSRGYKDTCLSKINSMRPFFENNTQIPWWLGSEDLHRSHRAMLYSKNNEFYQEFESSFEETQEYWWPSDHAPVTMVI